MFSFVTRKIAVKTKHKATLVQTLKAVYSQEDFCMKMSLYPWSSSEYFHLALIKKRRVTPKRVETDEFLRCTLHGHMDDIPMTKAKLKVEEIFKYKRKGSKKVLLEGAPGIGKTVLSTHLCQQWAEGKLLQEYDTVFFVPLNRFAANASELTLRDLSRIYLSSSMCDDAAKKLEEVCGENVLFILDGWDELPAEQKSRPSFFMDIIDGTKLPKASVMITSRPTMASELHHLVDRQVEVLGFKREQIEEYVRNNLACAEDKEKQQKTPADIWQYLKHYPHIKAMAHIPLLLSIICSVVNESHDLPETTTDYFKHYISQVISLNQTKFKKSNDYARATCISLCKIALKGILSCRFVFTAEELEEELESEGIKLNANFDGLGLLRVIPSIRNRSVGFDKGSSLTEGCELHYQFQHTTIQEFLAAQRIQELEAEEQIRHLSVHRNNRQFYNTWKFLAGITNLKENKLQDYITRSTNVKDSKEVLFLLHCLYEAHNPAICQETADWLHYKLNFSNTSLNPVDCLCAAYTVVSAGGFWDLSFRGSHIGVEGLEVIKEHLEEAHVKNCTKHYLLQITMLE